jgi:signal transduction histidine kinase
MLRNVLPKRLSGKGITLEFMLFLAAYAVWVILRPPESPGRGFIGSIAVLTPAITATIFIILTLPQKKEESKRSWLALGIALSAWSLGAAIRTFYQAVLVKQLPSLSIADIPILAAYPCLFFALVLYPFENRYAPSRFRFILDATIMSGVVATLGWIIITPPASISSVASISVSYFYPISDLVLLMVLINLFLANRKARRSLLYWAIGLALFFVSDFSYSIQVQVGGYQVGDFTSLGWIVGNFIFGASAVVEAAGVTPKKPASLANDLGGRVQNVIPVAFVFVLFWFIIAKWQVSGQLSLLGLWMSVILSLVLIVRVGVLTGERELFKYWQFFSSMPEPTFICDPKGKILLANAALLRSRGLEDESQATRIPFQDFFEGKTMPEDLILQAARTPISIEVHFRENQVPYLLSLHPIYSSPRQVFVAGIAYDLSSQKQHQKTVQNAYDELRNLSERLSKLNAQLEQRVEERTRTLSQALVRLEEQNKQLQELDQLKSDFVSMVSHELRTPLTSLQGGFELLLSGRIWPRKDRTALRLMKNEVQRLSRFVENILNVSALEAGRLKIDLQPVELPVLIGMVLDQFHSSLELDRIRTEIEAHLPAVLADESLLLGVLTHLVDNSMKYAPEGNILITAVRKGKKIEISIQDSGPGIPQGKRHLLFQRFQRLSPSDSQSVYGFGLGLYLSRKLLQSMNSDLKYTNRGIGGACFRFSMKVAK